MKGIPVSVPSIRAMALAFAVPAIAAAPAMADFVTPDAFGWSRGSANSTHFQWDIFSSPTGPNPPDVARFPETLPDGWPAPDVVDGSVGSFITGTGNIYNLNVPLEITSTIPNYALGDRAVTRVLVQVRTQGTEIDPASVAFGGVAPSQTQELLRIPMGEFGAIVDTLYYFEVPGSAAVYTLEFSGSLGSMSLDQLSVDTIALDAGSCPADWDGSGAVNSNDISAFLTDWLASVQQGDLVADFDGSGAVNSNDISAFLTAWLAATGGGC